MISHSLPVDRSVDRQIHDARLRAQMYTDSLTDAKRLEAERQRWIESFERKSVMVNQLEKELASAVEIIDMQRRQGARALSPINDTTVPLLSEEAIHQDMKKLLSSSFIQKEKGKYESMILSPVRSSADREDVRPSDPNVMWNEVLNQYKEQLLTTRAELAEAQHEKQNAAEHIMKLNAKLVEQQDDVKQLTLAKDDLTGKMQFRLQQV
jgi:hypothetical protein